MSTIAEIEAAIEKLDPDEFAKLAEWMASRNCASEEKGNDFKEAMDRVFSHHAPLLEKLAQ
ncbi:hypothetical protein [Luteolibacter sp. Populi]|uniref:hypothetical protein n=1 Tax=Luteolibacter sp. Populi TaxID=3230487 RepID=UPI003464F9B0